MAVRKKAQDSYFKDVEKYYKAKSLYESKYEKEKNKIMSSKNYKSIDDKREKLKKVKIPCTHCKRKVGMNFQITPTHFTGLCGDESQPCDFRLNIKKYKVVTQYPLLEALKRDRDKNMMDIIKLKLDVLFNYSSESEISSKFSLVRDEYMKNNKLYKNTVQTYKEITNRTEQQEELTTKKIELQKVDLEILDKYKNNLDTIRSKIDNQDINFYIDFIINSLFEANKYFNDQEPWKKKDDKLRLYTIVYTAIELIRKITILLYPVMPETAVKVLNIFNIKENQIDFSSLKQDDVLKEKNKINKLNILFKKIDK